MIVGATRRAAWSVKYRPLRPSFWLVSAVERKARANRLAWRQLVVRGDQRSGMAPGAVGEPSGVKCQMRPMRDRVTAQARSTSSRVELLTTGPAAERTRGIKTPAVLLTRGGPRIRRWLRGSVTTNILPAAP